MNPIQYTFLNLPFWTLRGKPRKLPQELFYLYFIRYQKMRIVKYLLRSISNRWLSPSRVCCFYTLFYLVRWTGGLTLRLASVWRRKCQTWGPTYSVFKVALVVTYCLVVTIHYSTATEHGTQADQVGCNSVPRWMWGDYSFMETTTVLSASLILGYAPHKL